MPAQVIVVKRPRRSLFAVPRAVPDWIRSLWAALRRGSMRAQGLAALASSETRSMNVPLFPDLVIDASGSHRCIGCDLCVRVCPTRCLSLETEGQGTVALRVTRFEFASGACMGCGFCADACPEQAIAMTRAEQRVEIAPLTGGSGVVDWLAAPSRLRG